MNDEMISFGARQQQLAELKPDAPAATCGEDTLTCGQLHRMPRCAAR